MISSGEQQQPPSPPAQSRARDHMDESYTVRGLLSRLRSEESRRVKEVATLNFQIQKYKKLLQKAEAEAKLSEDKRKFKESEALHLKMALERRDEIVTQLERHIDDVEKTHVPGDMLEKSEAECNTFRAKLIEKTSQVLHMKARIKQYKKEMDALKRDHTLICAKYEKLLESEDQARQHARQLTHKVQDLTSDQERRNGFVYDNLLNDQRIGLVRKLVGVGRLLDGAEDDFQSVPDDGSTTAALDDLSTRSDISDEALSL